MAVEHDPNRTNFSIEGEGVSAPAASPENDFNYHRPAQQEESLHLTGEKQNEEALDQKKKRGFAKGAIAAVAAAAVGIGAYFVGASESDSPKNQGVPTTEPGVSAPQTPGQTSEIAPTTTEAPKLSIDNMTDQTVKLVDQYGREYTGLEQFEEELRLSVAEYPTAASALKALGTEKLPLLVNTGTHSTSREFYNEGGLHKLEATEKRLQVVERLVQESFVTPDAKGTQSVIEFAHQYHDHLRGISEKNDRQYIIAPELVSESEGSVKFDIPTSEGPEHWTLTATFDRSEDGKSWVAKNISLTSPGKPLNK